MIPLKLHLKNFLSYGPTLQTIDFGPHKLICLTGKNGHGKSALLDAITWAIWGQARKISGTTKPDAQLLRIGQMHMMVIFDFLFHEHTYRIKREFSLSRSNAPFSVLEFGVMDPDNQKLKPLTDKTIRSTQAKIDSLLGIDFDTFVNSAFLRQGQANEFSKKSPKDRKEVLAAILQLQQYEAMRKKAQEKVKTAQQEFQTCAVLTEQMHQEIAQEHELTAQHQYSIAQLTQLQNQQEQIAQQTADCIQKQHKMMQELEHVKKTQNQYQMLIAEREQHAQLLRTQFEQWRLINRKHRNIPPIEQIQTQKEIIIKQLHELQKKQQTVTSLQAQFVQTQLKKQEIEKEFHQQFLNQVKQHELTLQHINAEYIQIQTQLKTIDQRIKQYHEELVSLKTQHEMLTRQMAAVPNNENILNEEQRFEKRKNYYYQWQTRLSMLHNEQMQLKHKQLLNIDSNNPSCPLCEQNLSATRKRFLQTKFKKLSMSLEHKIQRLTLVLNKLKSLLKDQHQNLIEFKKFQETYLVTQTKLSEAEKRINKLEELCALETQEKKQVMSQLESLETEKRKITAHIQQLEKNYEKELHRDNNYTHIESACKDLTGNIETMQNEIHNQQHLVKDLEKLQNLQQEHQNIVQEKTEQEYRKQEIHNLCVKIKDVKKQAQLLLPFIASEEKVKQEHANLEQEILSLRAHADQLEKERTTLLQQMGRLDQELKRIMQRKKELEKINKRSDQLQEIASDFALCAQALSKDGIQALLIEDALPEIEQEANQLLAKLTNNQSHIIIESLRDLKKGGTKETLDINISDPMGIRSYELFSGGEAFRIDFALRIAISKLLARRAGASLQILIIDEGFGSQDEEGLNLLMDGIYKIQDDFAKIIIVSHLPSMKEQFPVHFLITKEAQGSAVHVIQHS